MFKSSMWGITSLWRAKAIRLGPSPGTLKAEHKINLGVYIPYEGGDNLALASHPRMGHSHNFTCSVLNFRKQSCVEQVPDFRAFRLCNRQYMTHLCKITHRTKKCLFRTFNTQCCRDKTSCIQTVWLGIIDRNALLI